MASSVRGLVEIAPTESEPSSSFLIQTRENVCPPGRHSPKGRRHLDNSRVWPSPPPRRRISLAAISVFPSLAFTTTATTTTTFLQSLSSHLMHHIPASLEDAAVFVGTQTFFAPVSPTDRETLTK
ncbi:hypothetical protein MPTK2_4g22440 [Marchantia polymorpha subsp. ruderalis]